MTDTIDSLIIKEWLKNVPTVTLAALPLFRLVCSNDLTEIRRGIVQHYVDNVKVSETEEIGEFPKYTWLANRWILELWMAPEVAYTPEIPGSANGDYTAVYVFEDAKGQPLPLNLTVVQLIVNRVLRPRSTSMEIRSRIFAEAAEQEAALDRYTEDSIDTSPTASLLHNGEGGVVGSNHWIESPHLRTKQ